MTTSTSGRADAARAASVAQEIEQGPDEAPPPARRRGWVRVAGAVVAVGLMAGGAGLAVAAGSGSRQPGETATGDLPETTGGRLAEAAERATTGDPSGALEIYDDILDEEPENVEALSERGLLLASLAVPTDRPQLAEEGRRSIELALRINPDHARSLFYLGLVLRLAGQPEAGRAAIERALASDPSPILREQIEGFLETAGPGTDGSGPEGTTTTTTAPGP